VGAGSTVLRDGGYIIIFINRDLGSFPNILIIFGFILGIYLYSLLYIPPSTPYGIRDMGGGVYYIYYIYIHIIYITCINPS
jgi:hypothetical protein